MDGIFLNISGMDAVVANLNKLSEKIKTDVAIEMNASALNIQSNAKRNAPVNIGSLRQSIQLKETIGGGKILYEVGTKVSYAPYMEFGTGPMVNVPAGYNEFAMQFKGKGKGTFYDFLLAIAEWIRKKGITPKDATYNVKIPLKTIRRTGTKAEKFNQDVKMAEAIAYHILKKGIRPQPFLIPAYESEKPKLLAKISKIIKNDVKS